MSENNWGEIDDGPEWFYKVRGQPRRGPVPLSTVQHLRRSGRLPVTALVWSEGMSAWETYAKVFMPASSAGMASAGQASSKPVAPSGAKPRSAAKPPRPAAAGATRPSGGGAMRPVRPATHQATSVPTPSSETMATDAAAKAALLGIAVRRGLARWLDTTLFFGFLLATVHALAGRGFEPASRLLGEQGDNLISVMVAAVLAWIPLEAVMLALLRRTPGKWAFSLAVTGAPELAARWPQMWQRTWRVALQGMVLGIPVFSLIGQFVGFTMLISRGEVAWDKSSNTGIEVSDFEIRRIPIAIGIGVLIAAAASALIVDALAPSG